jgi:hypothetical protein
MQTSNIVLAVLAAVVFLLNTVLNRWACEVAKFFARFRATESGSVSLHRPTPQASRPSLSLCGGHGQTPKAPRAEPSRPTPKAA